MIAIGPWFLGRGIFSQRPFDDQLHKQVQNENPEVIFIGDSMLLTRFDSDCFKEITGKTPFVLATHGLSSAGWYLMLKNFVVDSDVKPLVVFVFFRDYGLSWPHYRTTGSYLEKLEPFMRLQEPVLDLVWRNADESSGALISRIIDRTYRLQRHHTKAEDFLQESALRFAPRVWTKRERLLDEVNDLFEIENLRKDVPTELARSDSPELEFFDSSPGETFVPHLIETAKQGGVQLCFYRVKRRPHEGFERRRDPVELQSYQESLRAYVEGQGMLYFDASDDPREHIGMFADGDHIAEEHRSAWTEIFCDQISGILK